MGKGKRYSGERRKLNMKKVAAVIIAIVVIIMFCITIKKLLSGEKKVADKQFPTAYFTVYTDDKWGVIDSKGNTVIEPTYDEMIVIPDSSKPVFICTYDVNYGSETYKTKVLNNENKNLFDMYDLVEAIEYVDSNNQLSYEKNVLKVSKNGKYGMIDLSGREIVSCDYDSIETLDETQGNLLVKKNGQYGVLDLEGNVMVDTQYKSVKPLTDKNKDGYVVENSQGLKGIVYSNKTKLECKYADIQQIYANDMYVVKENGSWKIINSDSQEFLKDYFEEVKSIDSSNIVIKKSGKYGVVTLDAKEVIPCTYDNLEYAFENYYIAKKDKNYGVINSNNETVVDFKYSKIINRSQANILQADKDDTYTSDLYDSSLKLALENVIVSNVDTDKGYMEIRKDDELKYYNFQFQEGKADKYLTDSNLFLSKKDGKYGYVNKDGVVVVNYNYDDATAQNKYGYAAIKKDGKWGAINSKGEVVVEPTYELKDNILIDFIGQWHLSEDVNAYYYTK